MSSLAFGNTLSSVEAESALSSRQDELTQQLALQIIQIITRNNARGVKKSDNATMISLMSSLLREAKSANGASQQTATSSVIYQFFMESADEEASAPAATPSSASSTAVAPSQQATCASQKIQNGQDQSQNTNALNNRQLQQANQGRNQQHLQQQAQQQNQPLQVANKNQGQAQQSMNPNDLLAQIGHLLGQKSQQPNGNGNPGSQGQPQLPAGPSQAWGNPQHQASAPGQGQQQQQQPPQQVASSQPSQQLQPPPSPQVSTSVTSQQMPSIASGAAQPLAQSQQMLPPPAACQQNQSSSGGSMQAPPLQQNHQQQNMNDILLLALLGNNLPPQQQQQFQQQLQQLQQSQPQPQAPNQNPQFPPPQNQFQQPQQQASHAQQQQQPQQQNQGFSALLNLLQNATGQNGAQRNALPAFPQGQQPQHAIQEVNIPNPNAYPMAGIEYPGPHDVVLGRGRGASSHIGNVNFRGLIKQWKPKYAAANRVDKPKVAGEVVGKWRQKNPPGRFLVQVRTSNRNLWNDVGDRKARQKTSQSLRERECIRKPRRKGREKEGGSSMGTMDDTSSVETGTENSDLEYEESNEDLSVKAEAGASSSRAAQISGESGESSSASGGDSESKPASRGHSQSS